MTGRAPFGADLLLPSGDPALERPGLGRRREPLAVVEHRGDEPVLGVRVER
jgi:hypothetical protein